jgi:histidyl-tRNA synthetase
MVVEAEICAAAAEVLRTLGFHDFNIRLNHRRVLTGILGVAGIGLDRHESALIALDKLDKIGRDGVKQELIARGIASVPADQLLNFFGDLATLEHAADIAVGDEGHKKQEALNKASLGRIVEFVRHNEIGASGVAELQLILDYGAAAGVSRHLQVDPSLARGLSYYTGAIMEISVKDLAGSLGGGGRYDNLVGMFLGQDVPACGFSLGLERILVVMTEREMFPPNVGSARADVVVAIWNEDFVHDSIALARELRAADLQVDLYPDTDKVGKQFKYAAARKVPFVAVIGDEEKATNEVSIKDLRTGEQRRVSRSSVAALIRGSLG